MKKFSKILGIVCLVFFVNIFYWRASHFALALVSGNVLLNDVVYIDCIGSNQVYGYPLNDENFTMSIGCDDWNGNPNYTYAEFGIDTWRLIEVKNINNFDCSNDEALLRPLTYNECLSSNYFVDSSVLKISDIPEPKISYLSIGTGSTTDLMASAGTLVTDIWAIIALAMGVPVSFFAIKRLISLVR